MSDTETQATNLNLVTSTTGPFKVAYPCPSTVEEYDLLSGEAGACLNDAVRYSIVWGQNDLFQNKFTPVLEQLGGIPREVDTKATEAKKAKSKNPGNVEDVLEKFGPWANRVLSAVGEERAKEIEAEAMAFSNNLALDLSPTSRSRGPKKQWLDKADEIIGRVESAREASIAKLLTMVDDTEVDRDEDGTPDRVSLARIIERALGSL